MRTYNCDTRIICPCTAFADFKTFPSDGCALPGDTVDFFCDAFYFRDSAQFRAVLVWVVTPISGPTMVLDSGFESPPPPVGFSFLTVGIIPSGLRVTANTTLSNASIQCIPYRPDTGDRINSTMAIASLQVAGDEKDLSIKML